MINKSEISPPGEPMAYDLGWLLQHEQVGDEQLCAFLIEETGTEIARLARLFLRAQDRQQAALERVLFRVLLERHSYKNSITGRAWLYRLALEECLERAPQYLLTCKERMGRAMQAIDLRAVEEGHFGELLRSLPQAPRLLALFHWGQNLSEEEIAVVLCISPEQARVGLEQARQALQAHRLDCEECSSRHSTVQGLETRLRAALQVEPQPEPAVTDPAAKAKMLLERLARERKRLNTRRWGQRGSLAGLAMLVLVIMGWAQFQSWLSPSQEKPFALAATVRPTPEPKATAVPQPTAAPTSDNPAAQILALMRSSRARWQSLWADVEVNTYATETLGDGASSQAVTTTRKQIWITPPRTARVVIGPPNGSPDLTYAIAGGRLTGQNFSGGQTLESTTTGLIPDADLRLLFWPTALFTRGGQFTQTNSETVAGRPTWVLDWTSGGQRLYRYWVDQEYWVILRRVEYGQGIFQPVISDITVAKIFYNADFPSAIFAPERYKGDHFAQDFSGNPEIEDLKTALQAWTQPGVTLPPTQNTPSPQVNLATARLSFQNVPAGWMQRADGPGLEVFANQKDLGKLPLGGKSILACQRSPDGSRIAYNSPPQDGGDTVLLVADLAALQSTRPALPNGITAGDFAFSPDARHLAFFGCEKASGFCGVFLLDLGNGKLTHLLPLMFADYITWSPDGRSIALVGNDDASEQAQIFSTRNLLTKEMQALLHTWHFQVIDAASGSLTYKTPFDWSSFGAPLDSPTNLWDTPFKIASVGLKGCTNPPDQVQ